MNQNGGMISAVTGWFAKPFNPGGDALDWILWVGLLIVAWWMWNSILITIRETV